MLNKDSIERMASFSGELCVSMYMTVNNINPEKNRIRLKNLVHDARKQLLALGTVSQKVNGMLAPLSMILDSAEFWKGSKKVGIGYYKSGGRYEVLGIRY